MYEVLANGLNNLGITYTNEKGDFRDPVDILLEIRGVIDNLPEDKKDTIRKFFI